MKTVLIDNSLCAYSLHDNASPEYIAKYIQALGESGVRYVEVDFRTVMKLRRLPKGIGYIFRLVDPMFLSLSEVFDFDYVLLTVADVRKKVKTSVPVMLELPVEVNQPRNAFCYARELVDGNVTAVRIRGSQPMMSRGEAFAYIGRLKNSVPVPIDMCPMNARKNALDSAVKFSAAGVDSLTLTMGLPERYCSLEEFYFTLMSVFDTLPPELRASPLCRATVYGRYIFRNGNTEGIPFLMDLLDHDIHFLQNADTGERVPMRMSLKDTEYLHGTFVTALERMAKDEDIPDDVFDDLNNAIRHYDTKFYNSELFNRKRRGLLN